jgi:hypothetical protein
MTFYHLVLFFMTAGIAPGFEGLEIDAGQDDDAD